MNKINFNSDWRFKRVVDEQWQSVTLPHDAAMFEERVKTAEAGVNTGWYLGSDYEYEKEFFVPEEYRDKNVIFEFEGVYRNAEIYLNGVKVLFKIGRAHV